MSVEGHAVGATGTFQKQGYLAGSGVPSVNPIIGLIGKEHVSASIDRGAFRKTEACRESDEPPAWTLCNEAEGIVDIARRKVLVCRQLTRRRLIGSSNGVHVNEACQGAQHCQENACSCLHISNPPCCTPRALLAVTLVLS
jgi:hypothetical protein